MIIGAPTFKLRGTFFAIATIACGTIVRQCLLYPPFTDLTGGANGLMLPAQQVDSILRLYFLTEIPYYYIALGALLITVIIIFTIVRSRLGYYLRAIREDEDAAESLGIKTNRVKLTALIISAIIMSVLGTLYSFKIKYIDPQSVSSYDMAIRIGITAIIGGLGTEWGADHRRFCHHPAAGARQFLPRDAGRGRRGLCHLRPDDDTDCVV